MHITLLIISLDNYKNLISNYKICVMRKLICIFIILVSILPKLDAQTKARLVESEEIKSLKDDTYIDVKITTFIFKKYDENKRLAEFTQLDALKLERFFMGQAGVLSCESEAINKRMTINSRKELADGEIGLQPKEVINELLPIIFLQNFTLSVTEVLLWFLKGFFFVIAQIMFLSSNLFFASFEIAR